MSFPVQSLSKKSATPTLGDLKKINHVVKLAKAQDNKIVFKHIDTKENLQIYGVSDASWSVKDRPVSGIVYMLGSTRTNTVSPLTWKSSAIQKSTKSVKDAETRALSLAAENSPHFARMVETQKTGFRVNKNKPLLETIASTRSPVNKDMNDAIRYLKDKLSWNEISSYSWLPTKRMILDFLTKELKINSNVWDIFRHNTWVDGHTDMNKVTVSGIEFQLSNPTIKEDDEAAG